MQPVVYPPEENIANEKEKFLKEHGAFWKQELNERRKQMEAAKKQSQQ